MRIDGSDYKVNILILLMEQEEDVTILTVETLLETVEEGVVISVLLNGGESRRLRDLFAGVDCIRYYESPVNLGVAGGRNFLFDTVECRSSDIVMVLDNDIVPALDFVRGLAAFLVRQQGAGVVGGCAVDIRCVDFSVVKHYGERGVWGNKLLKLRSEEIKTSLLSDLQPWRLYHIGSHKDYYYAYFSARPFLFSLVGGVLKFLAVPIWPFRPSLKENDRYLGMLKKGADRIQVSNVPGGIQAFRRDLLDNIGCLDDRFNPYGYEDVEFCIRAIRAGYSNFMDTNTWLYHGTDERQRARDEHRMRRLIYRGRTVLTALCYPNPFRHRTIMLKLILTEILLLLIRPKRGGLRKVYWLYEGYREGISLIKGWRTRMS